MLYSMFFVCDVAQIYYHPVSVLIVMLILAHSKIGHFSSPYDPFVHLASRKLSLLPGMVKQGTGGWAVREEEIPHGPRALTEHPPATTER